VSVYWLQFCTYPVRTSALVTEVSVGFLSLCSRIPWQYLQINHNYLQSPCLLIIHDHFRISLNSYGSGKVIS
jgi:hypothetical protein